MEFFTIGAYNSTENDFFSKLINNHIDTFCDIRQRRGVRGAKYAFVNSRRLQEKLIELGINYIYNQELAPTNDIRELQKSADQQNKETKRERMKLGECFSNEYKSRILDGFDFEGFIKNLNIGEAHRIVLFCVEEHADACHRSIVAQQLKEKYSYNINHL